MKRRCNGPGAGSIAASGVELSSGIRYSGTVPVPAGAVVVLREE